LALAIWESWRGRPRRGRLRTVLALFAPLLPLAAWYGYHWRKTGYVFGNPQYLRYNATTTLTPERVLLALAHRVMHLTFHMNLFVPVAAMLGCLLLPPVSEDGEAQAKSNETVLRRRIAPEYQAIFYVTIVANAVFFSLIGGALLTRYL